MILRVAYKAITLGKVCFEINLFLDYSNNDFFKVDKDDRSESDDASNHEKEKQN
jgi:hypothetical protein